MKELATRLTSLEGKSYKAYKQLAGSYRFPDYMLHIDHVQGDPFARPSRIRVQLSMKTAAFPEQLWHQPIRRTACEDYLGRAVAQAINQHVKGERGSGRSGEISIATSDQQVLQRNAVLIAETQIEVRMNLGLPAQLRRIDAHAARLMLFEELPTVVKSALLYSNSDSAQILAHVNSVEDQKLLRDWLVSENLVAFIADGSRLPRRSGVDDRPMAGKVVAFQAPDSLARNVELPHAGTIRGMAIPQGVSLIVGGGFHGKSTLLHAVEYGVYNHIPGDGRELVATEPTCMKVRAEDGRAIHAVDISPFIDNLPFGRDSKIFETENASGSTSQAANIIEALQCGSHSLLMDEDTSATNFMIRDARMQALVAADKEPITPFLHRVRELYERHGISSIIVMGGSGDYFAIADTVIMLDNYEVRDATADARHLAGDRPGVSSEWPTFSLRATRRPDKKVVDGAKGRHVVKVDVPTLKELLYGRHRVDLGQVEQLVDRGQTLAIGWILHYYAQHLLENKRDACQNLELILELLEREGLDILTPYVMGELAMPRLQEVAAALNRIREGNWEGSNNKAPGAADR